MKSDVLKIDTKINYVAKGLIYFLHDFINLYANI